MRMTGATTYYPNEQEIPIYGVSQEPIFSSNYEPNPTSFLYNLSLLKDKVQQVQSLATIFLSPDHGQPPESTAITVPTMGTLIQEIIVTASSMMLVCQQMSLNYVLANNNNNNVHLGHQHANKVVESGVPLPQLNCDQLGHQRANKVTELGTPLPQLDHHRANKVVESSTLSAQSGSGRAYFSDHHDAFDHWYGDNYNIFTSTNNNIHTTTNVTSSNATKEGFSKELTHKMEKSESSKCSLPNNYDIVELDASDLLAKYTHYCQVCGKGFKRDANLRMHMRAHGDEYKSTAALSNPMKNNIYANGENADDASKVPRKYSCPQEGCRWNKRHAKFQPLKSMICVKNHYKRSHCPKMYVCKRCNTKQFSVLSDLRTHEKHCGDLKWQCSCGTTFSRKDKLMGHVALFIGHSPVVISSLMKVGNGAQGVVQMQLDDSR